MTKSKIDLFVPVGTFVFGILTGFLLAIAINNLLISHNQSADQKVLEFVHNTISSIVNGTDYYQKHTMKDAQDSISKSKSDFTNSYFLELVDRGIGNNAVFIEFENEKRYYTVVLGEDEGDFILQSWEATRPIYSYSTSSSESGELSK